ncbi:hypothetical protein [Sphingomonas sanguinis]|jgi:hypothetical protein|uniref:Uncharacterized protein n=1 Tax=Sphingomonas sanguinis TaxID=33051 RepID=A0A7Y7QTA0_9SPHN|nr:hypothetical protein [Sphingomonas sanguinis]MBZ6380981.1 hypothetical protein [Sphingomonas sanguinis]NNG49267.1 hypothetical protein [Sphingomonas sanguinis]NNG55366.1 hypothetical protein [Sphingomonas sanguinis]NVP30282.1 hypothetical protein [Sphingomonas sanguinis]
MFNQRGGTFVAPFVSDSDVATASAMIERFGGAAGDEAAIRAGRSRDIGNHIHFCRWRQIERLIDLLQLEEVFGTVH